MGWRGWTWTVPLGLIACGPSVEGGDDGQEPSSSSSAGTSTTTTELTSDASTTTTGLPSDTSTTGDADAELCLQWCLSAELRGCAEVFTDETCYTRCLASLDAAGTDDCAEEHRGVLACEGRAPPPATPSCEASACEEVYKRHDLCGGECLHLDGSPGSGASPETCEWRATSCYGHEFEAVCPVDDAAGVCDCIVDGELVAHCEAGVALVPFGCGGPTFGVFDGCCRDVFEGVLLP